MKYFLCFKFGMLFRRVDLIFFPLSKVSIVSRRKRKLPGRSIEYFVVACRVGCTCFDPGNQKNALNLKRQPEEKEEYFIFLQTDNLSVAQTNTSIAIASIGSSCSISSKTSLAL